MKYCIISLSCCLVLVCSSHAQKNLAHGIDSIFKSYIDSGLAGSLVVVKDKGMILQKAYGYANNEKKSANTPATLFNVASIGKQFTMFAILQLERNGRLRTSDYLAKYIGPFGDIRDSITLLHLLCHTSGIAKQGAELDYKTRAGFIGSVKSTAVESRAGEKYRYTNAGYNILAAVVEIVSGMPFENYLRKNIFGPLGMTHTGYPWETHINKKMLATGYNNKHEALPVQENIWAARGPGNLVTTMEDLYKWMLAYSDEQFMPSVIKQKILTDYRPGEESYSWTKTTTNHGTHFYHKGGGRSDFESRLMWWPDDKVIVIFSLNNDYNLARRLFSAIRDYMN